MTIRLKTMLLTGSLLAISMLGVYLTAYVLFIRHINQLERDQSIERLTTTRNVIHHSASNIRQTLFDWAVWDATYEFSALLLIGSILILTTLVLQRRLVLDPLTRLSEQVHRIGQQSPLSGRVKIPCFGDELDSVVTTINRTLNALEKAQIDLNESAKRFTSLFESMTEGVALHQLIRDVDGTPVNYRILDVNPAYLRHTGLQRQQVHGVLATEAYGITPPPFLENYARVASTGCTHSFETYFAPLQKPFAIAAFSLGQDTFATVFEDITERKKAEERIRAAQAETQRLLVLSEQSHQALLSVAEDQKETQAALRDSEEKYRLLFEGAGDAIFLHDAEERILAANTMACEQYGYTQSELTSMTVRMVDTPDQVVKVKERIARLMEQGYVKFETVHRRKDGSFMPTEVNARRVTWHGQPAVMSICRDITERKRAEKERETSIELLNLLNTAENLQELIRKVVKFFQNLSGSEAVGVRLQDGEDFPYYDTVGFSSDFVQAESRLCNVGPDGRPLRNQNGSPILKCMCGNVLQRRFDAAEPFFSEYGSFWTHSTSEWPAATSDDDRQALAQRRCLGDGYESVALVPLRADETIYGLLQLNDRRKGQFTTDFITSIEKLCDSVASTLAKRAAEDRLRETLGDLEKFNRHMIGREMRILELKKEINKLLVKLGETPRYTTTLEAETST